MSRVPPIAAEGRGRGIALVAFLALGQAIAAGAAAFATREVFLALGDPGQPLPLRALVLIALAGSAIATLRVMERVVAERVGQDYAASLRLKLFRHLSRMSARDVADRRSGALAMRFVGDLTAVRNWVSLGIARLISAGIVLPAATGVVFLVNPALGWAAAVPIALGVLAMALAAPRLGPVHRRLRARRSRLAADMSERVPHAPELRLQGRIDIERRHLLRRTRELVAVALARARGAAILRAIPDAVSGIAAASLLFVALHNGAAGAEAAAALAALSLMILPMRDLAGVWDRQRAWVAARDKCDALLQTPRLKRRERPAGPLPAAPPCLLFQDVATGLLDGIDIEATAGTKIAIVGGNGAGKSTLLALAAGLEQPRRGKVMLGELDPGSLSAAERRRIITLVSGRSPILAGSLRRALTMGVAQRPADVEILAQAEELGLTDVVRRLGGLDGRLAEGGRNLSAGEARRVLLVRAALSAPQILLLDEPDDALDANGPALVEEMVRRSDATTLIVTHNAALARRMDAIWYLERGRIVESGPTAEILARNGPAARFLALHLAA